jgi:arylsulfatase A-like enzyme
MFFHALSPLQFLYRLDAIFSLFWSFVMKKKNLLYVFADQWRYDALSFVKRDPVFTPNMDAFCSESIQCENAISTYPLCSPHRAALLTGKYPLSCGFWTNCKLGLFLSPTLSPQETLMSDVLKQEGYETAYIGKWHLDSSEKNFRKEPESEATNWDAYTPPGERRHHFDFWHSYGAMDKHLQPHYWEDSAKQIQPNTWSPIHETDVLLSYLGEKRNFEKPFYAVLSYNPPHPPYDAVPEKYMQLYEGMQLLQKENIPLALKDAEQVKQYFAAISGLDEQFGRILAYLKEQNLYDDTIVVLSADHGDMMTSQGLFGKNVWYEESIHIPLYIHVPQKQGTQNANLIESCDHMPILLDLLGIPVPDTVQGINALEIEKEVAFLCMCPGMPDLVDAYLEKGLDSKCFGWRGVRGKTFTYVIDNGTEPEAKQKRLYYDNEKDPMQLNPIILGKEDAICRKYDPLLKEWSKKQKDFFLYEANN